MREILFRGKTTEGKWVVGLPTRKRPLDKEINRIQLLDDYYENDITMFFCVKDVIPGTVGQYTGLSDKNGKKIFEGDIVEGHCHSQWSHRLQRCVVEYDRDGFEARHYVEQSGTMRYYSYKVLFSKDVEVIGNIHDNPELLKGE
jgi:uncharacterized phage protein (TIGR01671 family)